MRLIDADKLLELIKEQKEKEIGGYTKGINAGLSIVKSIINDEAQTPTTYDVDKVVEQLEKAKDEIANEDYCRGINDKGKCDGRNCFKCCAEYLIEIVKAGGIDE